MSLPQDGNGENTIMIPDLPEGKTKEQRAAYAMEYADHIERERLSKLRQRRIHAEGHGAPEWFLCIADMEIGRILYNISVLREWPCRTDPRRMAHDTSVRIYRVDEMLHNFIKPSRVHPVRVKRAREWLAASEGE